MTRLKYLELFVIYFLLFLSSNLPVTLAQPAPVLTLDISSNTNVRDIAISHDGNKILTVIDDLRIWDSQTGERLSTYSDPNVRVIFSAAFSSDDTLIATGDAGHNAIIWDAQTGLILQRYPSYDMNPLNGGIRGVAFTPDGSKILMGNGNGALQLYDVKTGQELMRYRNRGTIETLMILPDGNRYVLWRTGAVIIIAGECEVLNGFKREMRRTYRLL